MAAITDYRTDMRANYMNRSSSPQRDALYWCGRILCSSHRPIMIPAAAASVKDPQGHDTRRRNRIGSGNKAGRQPSQTGPPPTLFFVFSPTKRWSAEHTHTQKADTAGVTVTTVTVTQQGSWPPPPSPPPPPPLPVANLLRSFVENPSPALPENG